MCLFYSFDITVPYTRLQLTQGKSHMFVVIKQPKCEMQYYIHTLQVT